jgi:hypothetical protein
MTKARTGYALRRARMEAKAEAIKTPVCEILARPPSGDDAVRIALIDNRRLQAIYAGVCMGETELVRGTHTRFVVVTVAACETRGSCHA